MSYVQDSLGPGEEIVHQASIHWIVYASPAGATLVGFALVGGAASIRRALPDLGDFVLYGAVGFLAFGLVWLFAAWFLARSTELAVTTRKVVAKWGLIARSTIEQRLEKVDSISVDQSFWGRLLNFGNVTIHGTGINATPIKMIADPLIFRRKVEHAIEGRREVG